jgi:hypothetical protein
MFTVSVTVDVVVSRRGVVVVTVLVTTAVVVSVMFTGVATVTVVVFVTVSSKTLYCVKVAGGMKCGETATPPPNPAKNIATATAINRAKPLESFKTGAPQKKRSAL